MTDILSKLIPLDKFFNTSLELLHLVLPPILVEKIPILFPLLRFSILF